MQRRRGAVLFQQFHIYRAPKSLQINIRQSQRHIARQVNINYALGKIQIFHFNALRNNRLHKSVRRPGQQFLQSHPNSIAAGLNPKNQRHQQIAIRGLKKSRYGSLRLFGD